MNGPGPDTVISWCGDAEGIEQERWSADYVILYIIRRMLASHELINGDLYSAGLNSRSEVPCHESCSFIHQSCTVSLLSSVDIVHTLF